MSIPRPNRLSRAGSTDRLTLQITHQYCLAEMWPFFCVDLRLGCESRRVIAFSVAYACFVLLQCDP